MTFPVLKYLSTVSLSIPLPLSLPLYLSLSPPPAAFIAALYIDKDLEYVHTFMNVCFFPRLKVRSPSTPGAFTASDNPYSGSLVFSQGERGREGDT